MEKTKQEVKTEKHYRDYFDDVLHGEIIDEKKKTDKLKEEAYDAKHQDYTRKFTDYEIQEFKDELPPLMTKLHEIDVAFEKVKAAYKIQREPHQSRLDYITDAFVTGEEKVDDGKVYFFKNEVISRMALYDRLGRYIMNRPLLPTEQQMKISVHKGRNSYEKSEKGEEDDE